MVRGGPPETASKRTASLPAGAPGRLAHQPEALGWLIAHGWYRTRLHGSVPVV